MGSTSPSPHPIRGKRWLAQLVSKRLAEIAFRIRFELLLRLASTRYDFLDTFEDFGFGHDRET
jgi:hypothetical protein